MQTMAPCMPSSPTISSTGQAPPPPSRRRQRGGHRSLAALPVGAALAGSHSPFLAGQQGSGLSRGGGGRGLAGRQQQRHGGRGSLVVVASFFGVGAPEAVLVGVVALVVFGPKGLAEAVKTVGKTLRGFQPVIREFVDATSEMRSTLTEGIGLDEIRAEFRGEPLPEFPPPPRPVAVSYPSPSPSVKATPIPLASSGRPPKRSLMDSILQDPTRDPPPPQAGTSTVVSASPEGIRSPTTLGAVSADVARQLDCNPTINPTPIPNVAPSANPSANPTSVSVSSSNGSGGEGGPPPKRFAMEGGSSEELERMRAESLAAAWGGSIPQTLTSEREGVPQAPVVTAGLGQLSVEELERELARRKAGVEQEHATRV